MIGLSSNISLDRSIHSRVKRIISMIGNILWPDRQKLDINVPHAHGGVRSPLIKRIDRASKK